MKFQFFQILIFLHVLAFLWPVIAGILIIIWAIQKLVYAICKGLQALSWRDRECKEPTPLRDLLKNPFKNLNLPLFLYTEDGCERCRCKVDDQDLDEENNTVLFDLIENLEQIEETNVSYLADLATLVSYSPWNNNLSNESYNPYYLTQSETYTEAINVMLAGNAAANIEYRRLPLWAGNDGEGRNFRVFSTSLTIAERLNLFNTKAKYYDNMTVNAPCNDCDGLTEAAKARKRRESAISPGNTGWNQIRVTWNTYDNNPNEKYHYDNVIVLLTDQDYFFRGQVLSFQDPSMSNDPHVLTTTGICLNPSFVEVKYANPNTDPELSPLLSTIYDIDITRYPESSYVAPNGDIRLGALQKKQVCFPMDIEYFQVLQEMSYQDYYYFTYRAAPTNLDDLRFSLPWRVLRNQRGYNLNDGATLKFYSNYETAVGNPGAVQFGNGQWVYRQVEAAPGTFDCFGACFYSTTHVTNNLNPIRSFFPYTETDPEFLSTERPDPKLRVVFLQRGVDINAPRLRNRYDLRRLFGVAGDWNDIPRIDHIDTNVGASFDISDACIINGNFFPNIPIQPGGTTLFGYNTNNSTGWQLNGLVQSIDINGRPILNREYEFLGVLQTNLIQPSNQAVIDIDSLAESTGNYVDQNDVFNGGIFTAPSSNSFNFTFFLRYRGEVNQQNGLVIILRNITTSSPEWSSGNIELSTSISSYTEEVSLFLTQGHQFMMTIRKFTFTEITYYADEAEWVYNNPNGLKLPKHNEFTENSPTTYNPNTGNIFFSSQFFRIPVNSFTAFTSTMPNYYSALDENTIFWGSQENSAWRQIYRTNLIDGGINTDGQFGALVINNDGVINNVDGANADNGFTKVVVPNNFGVSNDGGLAIPCAVSDLIGDVWNYCGTRPDVGVVADGSCDCDTDPQTGCPGCCRDRENLRYRLYVYHATLPASYLNEVGSYWGKEYVEGGSAFSLKLIRSSDNFQLSYSSYRNCFYADPSGQELFGDSNDAQWGSNDNNRGGTCYDNCDQKRVRSTYFTGDRQQYISPCYANFPNVDPDPDYVSFFGGDVEEARRTWYVNPNHEVAINYGAMNVFRTDRLPSSTTPQGDGNGNGYLLHQNNGFSIFSINIDDCSFELEGGGTIPDPVQTVDVELENIPNEYLTVASSLSNCALAVDLNSYYVAEDPITGNEYPAIHEQGQGYSRQPADLGADWVWFNRGRGCYNLVSKPLASLFPHQIPNDPDNKFYWDIATVVEWIQRLKLTFAQCFEIFSHTFSNNWINGTLYAFPFQNATRFDSQNQPFREFCKDVIYFHDPTNNYYYRSSPWNGTNFVGKYRDEGERGNLRNLQTPTTILDMGPKAAFIQEIVLSDDYDGYIVSRVPSTSFQDVTDILNLFILNRLVNTSFIQQLIPLPVDEGGNEEGSDDPSIGAMFANTRWKNGDAFFSNLVPGLIDGDYSQLISINSEFGVGEYSPETYNNTDIFFGEDEGRGVILGFRNRRYSSKRPVLGIYFSGDNQLRDYISPRRTIWNQNALIPVQDADFTDITTKTQVVPFYQWNIFHDRSDPDEGPSIFGVQSNNFITDLNKPSNYYTNSETFPDGFFAHGYQSLDRFGNSSEYFNPDGNNTFTYKGYIINYIEELDAEGNLVGYTPTYQAQTNPRYRYTFGAPFHFYFGLKQGSSAMDRFISTYVDTTVIYE